MDIMFLNLNFKDYLNFLIKQIQDLLIINNLCLELEVN